MLRRGRIDNAKLHPVNLNLIMEPQELTFLFVISQLTLTSLIYIDYQQ